VARDPLDGFDRVYSVRGTARYGERCRVLMRDAAAGPASMLVVFADGLRLLVRPRDARRGRREFKQGELFDA
jgi:hypothetical protein